MDLPDRPPAVSTSSPAKAQPPLLTAPSINIPSDRLPLSPPSYPTASFADPFSFVRPSSIDLPVHSSIHSLSDRSIDASDHRCAAPRPSRRPSKRRRPTAASSIPEALPAAEAATPGVQLIASEKRRAQNRLAQRNFRERKEIQARKNEETLVLRTEENVRLRARIQSLEAENAFLRQHAAGAVLDQLEAIMASRVPARPPDPVLPVVRTQGVPLDDDHARAATALSALARAPDSLFDPALQEPSCEDGLDGNLHPSLCRWTPSRPAAENVGSQVSQLSRQAGASKRGRRRVEEVWQELWETQFGGADVDIDDGNRIETLEDVWALVEDRRSAEAKGRTSRARKRWARPPELSLEGELVEAGEILSGSEAWKIVVGQRALDEDEQMEIGWKMFKDSNCYKGKVILSKSNVEKLVDDSSRGSMRPPLKKKE